MKDSQLTFRLPENLVRLLAQRARERGVNKSQVVREAIQVYLELGPAGAPGASWERVKHMVASQPLDHQALARDDIARLIRTHNWRDGRRR